MQEPNYMLSILDFFFQLYVQEKLFRLFIVYYSVVICITILALAFHLFSCSTGMNTCPINMLLLHEIQPAPCLALSFSLFDENFSGLRIFGLDLFSNNLIHVWIN